MFLELDLSWLAGIKFPALLAILLGLLAFAFATFRFLMWVFRRKPKPNPIFRPVHDPRKERENQNRNY